MRPSPRRIVRLIVLPHLLDHDGRGVHARPEDVGRSGLSRDHPVGREAVQPLVSVPSALNTLETEWRMRLETALQTGSAFAASARAFSTATRAGTISASAM